MELNDLDFSISCEPWGGKEVGDVEQMMITMHRKIMGINFNTAQVFSNHYFGLDKEKFEHVVNTLHEVFKIMSQEMNYYIKKKLECKHD